MGSSTAISWTSATWNFVVGCTRVSAGCNECYAFREHDMRHAAWKAGRWPTAPPQYHKPFTEVQVIADRLVYPFTWRQPRRIFVNSISDFWHAKIATATLAEAFAVMAQTPRHIYQILTKRPERMRRLMNDPRFVAEIEGLVADGYGGRHATGVWPGWPLPNVWLGVSVENQEVDFRIDLLAKTAAAVRFLSCEPLLGPIGLSRWLLPSSGVIPIHWIIAGGESGENFREMDLDWPQSLADQCAAAGVAFWMKQDSGRKPGRQGRIPDELWTIKHFPDGGSLIVEPAAPRQQRRIAAGQTTMDWSLS